MINLCKIFNPGWTESEIDRIFEENMQVIIAVIDEDELKCDYDPSQHGQLRSGFIAYQSRIALERFYLCKDYFLINL